MIHLSGSSSGTNIKITSIKLLNQKENKTFEIIKKDEPVYIAADAAQKNINNYKNLFINKAVFKFNETRANKIYITFEQPTFKDVTIKHTYWTPYEIGKDSKWNNQSRFNPEAALDSTNQTVNWDKLALVPRISNPTEFKSSATDSRIVQVSYTNQISADKWQLKILEPNKPTSGDVAATVINEFYWNKRDNNYNIDLFCTKQYANYYPDSAGMNSIRDRILSSPLNSACVLIDPQKEDPIKDIIISLNDITIASSVATVTTASAHRLSVDDYVFIRGFRDLGGGNSLELKKIFKVTTINSPTKFSFAVTEYSNLATTQISSASFFCVKAMNPATENTLQVVKSVEQTSNKVTRQIVAKRNFEEIKAKRASIGIRDISFGKEFYQNSAQMVSKPFLLSGDLDLLSIYAEDYNPNPSQASIRYHISVDGGTTFYEIQPVQRNYTGVPEIMAFNQNLSGDATIPQVLYLNSGNNSGVPNPIRSIVVKIDIAKNRQANDTPVVYYYRLGTRFR